jgi:hypothetical protein
VAVVRQNQLNLVFVRGDLTPQALQFRRAIELMADLVSGQASLSTIPCPIAIAANTIITFDNGASVTVASPGAALNATSIPIATYTGVKVPLSSVATVGNLSLTGRTYSAAVRQFYDSTTNLFSLTCTQNNSTGLVSMALPSGLSVAANAMARQFSLISNLGKPDPNIESLHLPIGSKVTSPLLDSAYYWDLKFTQSSVVTTVFSGRFWLIQEV